MKVIFDGYKVECTADEFNAIRRGAGSEDSEYESLGIFVKQEDDHELTALWDDYQIRTKSLGRLSGILTKAGIDRKYDQHMIPIFNRDQLKDNFKSILGRLEKTYGIDASKSGKDEAPAH